MDTPKWTAQDNEVLKVLGIAPVEDEPVQRSSWATERVLQAACEGAVLLDPQPGLFDAEIRIEIDGRNATEVEARALVELTSNGYVDFVGDRVTCSESGGRLLARWAKYRPCNFNSRRNAA